MIAPATIRDIVVTVRKINLDGTLEPPIEIHIPIEKENLEEDGRIDQSHE